MHRILLQSTDVWGNARLQSLFHWFSETHLVDDRYLKSPIYEYVNEKPSGAKLSVASSTARSSIVGVLGNWFGSSVSSDSSMISNTESISAKSEISASHVPLRKQLNELIDVVLYGVDGGSNILHTLNSTTVVCFCDLQGLIADTCYDLGEVCLCQSYPSSALPLNTQSEHFKLKPINLDVFPDISNSQGVRFEYPASARSMIGGLKPLSLAMAITQQPPMRSLIASSDSLFSSNAYSPCIADNFKAEDAINKCVCSVTHLVGLKSDVLSSFKSTNVSLLIELVGESSTVRRQNHLLEATLSEKLSPPRTPGHKIPDYFGPTELNFDNPNFIDNIMGGCELFSICCLVHDSMNDQWHIFSRGSPGKVLDRCLLYYDGAKIHKLHAEGRRSLSHLISQWRSSGLEYVAYSYRPIKCDVALNLQDKLDVENVFWRNRSTADFEMSPSTSTVVGPCWKRYKVFGSQKDTQKEGLTEDEIVNTLGGEQILLGMAALKQTTSHQAVQQFHDAGIRFVYFGRDDDSKTRAVGNILGLETGWNCQLNLKSCEYEKRNLDGRVILPSGIEAIKEHIKDVDSVPLQVSLFSNGTTLSMKEMVKVYQEHHETVTCVGSALRPSNFDLFHQSDASISLLIGPHPICRYCHGRRWVGDVSHHTTESIPSMKQIKVN
eukprot:GHVL01018014.1.p1 GENE.GHVL01018014.1~~GHVL01018014.1.p1  ORF type:complete len:664 (-),score=104.79 GHVL01018014.1:1115-3106(-)